MPQLCTLNLNGIRSAERRGFSRWLKKHKPDYLCVQELRAQESDLEEHLLQPEGWSAAFHPAAKKGYSGVGVYARRCPERLTRGLPFDHLADEGRALRADFEGFSVVSLYAPSGSSGEVRQAAKFRFLDELDPWFDAMAAEGRPIAVCGDYNIAPTAMDLARPRQNEKNSGFLPEERAWFERLGRRGWTAVVRRANPDDPALWSWWSNRGQAREKDIGWRIDHVLCNEAFARLVDGARIDKKAGLSDHAPVWVDFRQP
jgi:exodeoxyribonuclease-3